ncbi:hypothetical protein [Sphaerimonospora thailandensis]|uniref:Uncharacterized protein n=1 Tax=Sphaerimonospora thailandensis TaxID=795644 RepID=A0A8J3R9U7_9ACTN|nr:hypothetical protein [Sphaerimonospora thailandensis]GIH70416.1 hypothetical protein Mth01_26690 [Sphaerimonospora thailandensis]
MKRIPVWAVATIAAPVVVAAVVATTLTLAGSRESSPALAVGTDAASTEVVVGHGRDRTASRTASDWATYADHVVVVTAVQETEKQPSKKEIERGEGMIGRTVTERIDKVLWSAPDAPQPPPGILQMSVPGWVFNNNDGHGKRKFAIADSSRIEVGHTYIRAIEWIDDPCSDDVAKGKWDALGTGSVIPFDQGVLGMGEFEGEGRSAETAKAKLKSVDPQVWTLRDKTLGGNANTLVAELKTAKPRKENVMRRECNPQDQ